MLRWVKVDILKDSMKGEMEQIYEAWADAQEERPRKKGKRVDPNSKTARAIRSARKRAGLERRQMEAREKLRKTAERLSELVKKDAAGDYLAEYASWVASSRAQGFVDLDRSDLTITSTTPSVGAGGQHRDHKQTARQLFHALTGIEVVSEERLGGEQNTQQALLLMYEKLDKHLRLWDSILPKKLRQQEMEAHILSELTHLVPDNHKNIPSP